MSELEDPVATILRLSQRDPRPVYLYMVQEETLGKEWAGYLVARLFSGFLHIFSSDYKCH